MRYSIPEWHSKLDFSWSEKVNSRREMLFPVQCAARPQSTLRCHQGCTRYSLAVASEIYQGKV